MTRILIAGDTCPMGKIENQFIGGQAESIIHDLLPEFERSDFSILNLECPLISKKTPIDKDGPVLGSKIDCINGIKKLGIDAVNLANNHILDHGEDGIDSTINACENNDVMYFGAGQNIAAANTPLIKTINCEKFCFIGIAEHEFCIANEKNAGANPLNIISLVQTIKQYKNEFNHLIILIHGGKEYYQYPTPKLQELCRFLVDQGAAAVICQHSHCIGSFERYNDKLIVYGQGNFIFENLKRKTDMWNIGMLVSLKFKDGKIFEDFIPFIQSKDSLGAKKLSSNYEKVILDDFYKRSKEILSSDFVQKKWTRLCSDEKYLYASRVRGHNRFLRVLNRYTHFSDWLYSKSTKLMIRNVVECEVHREGLETLWRNKDVDF